MLDWDPSGWLILLLRKLGLAPNLRTARSEDIKSAVWHMHCKTHGEAEADHCAGAREEQRHKPAGSLVAMRTEDVFAYVEQDERRVVLLVDRHVVDATGYLHDHVRRSDSL